MPGRDLPIDDDWSAEGREEAPWTGRRFRQPVPRPLRATWTVPAVATAAAESTRLAQMTRGDVAAAFSASDANATRRTRAGSAPGGAAVLAVLAASSQMSEEAPGVLGIVLIRRASHLRANPGEIALPGGRIEPGEDAVAAALREAHEEVGLDPAAVSVVGHLEPVRRPSHVQAIHPVIATASCTPTMCANPSEVEEILVVPLADLIAPGRHWQEQWDSGVEPAFTMHLFDLGEDLLWGATGRIVAALLGRLLASPARPAAL